VLFRSYAPACIPSRSRFRPGHCPVIPLPSRSGSVPVRAGMPLPSRSRSVPEPGSGYQAKA
ncbi:MAG: hypothetical protein K2J87_01860, partial [Muribaculaceae bacterium]|nr:hypothetical protein [Muribaculaceae bacterium]